MLSAPTGTVTFLFTDIEGSTALAQAQPAGWETARQRHHAILREAIEAHHGYVFQIAGDAFCAAFATASDALLAALSAQRELQRITNEGGIPSDAGRTEMKDEKKPGASNDSSFILHPSSLNIRVRMGLHTGPAEWRNGEYDGYLTLARAQRIMSVGHGGQILLSLVTAELVRAALPASVGLRDMGEHRLKSLNQPEHLFQLVAPDLPTEFPPLVSLSARPNNLPVQLTSFIGREREMAEIKRLLANTRLLTLTGSGGTGKTRLSLQVAADLLDQFPNGVWLVELAPLADPMLVPQTVATALGLREEPGRAISDSLSEFLRDKSLLLILDNCEHLIDASAGLADALLHAAPQLKILASSREALGIAGETAYHVPSLPMPNPRDTLSPSDLAAFDSVRLFVERAAAAKTGFMLTRDNASAVTQVCARLDGIPLAVELAAARVRALPVEQIAARLDDRFRLLTGGSRTALPRQQTLRALIDWSYALLTEPERTLLRRLSVFAGGWTLEAAEAVCADDGRPQSIDGGHKSMELQSADILDLLTRLVEKSLVVLDGGADGRYHMLETIRQYARDRLLESGEISNVRVRHLEFFKSLAEEFSKLHGYEPRWWYAMLEVEQDNMRSAIDWALESGSVESSSAIVRGLYHWWQQRQVREGLEHFRAILNRPEIAARTAIRSEVLDSAAALSIWHGNYDAGETLAAEALSIAREIGNNAILSSSLQSLGEIAYAVQNYAGAKSHFTESLQVLRKTRAPYAHTLMRLGDVWLAEGNYLKATSLYKESDALFREAGIKAAFAMPLRRLGYAAIFSGEYTQAVKPIRESLSLNLEVNDKRAVAACLAAWAALASALGRNTEAVELHSAAQVFLEAEHMQLGTFDGIQVDRSLSELRSRLGPIAFEIAWHAGRAMTLDQAIAYVLETE